MTCSIRDGAEQKIWKKLHYLKGLKKKREKFKSLPPLKIGVLGMLYFNLIFLEPQ
jgi:tRNA A37 methylthiotransferase MiaB